MYCFGQTVKLHCFSAEDFAAEGLNGFLYRQLPGFWGIDWRHERFPGWFSWNRDKREALVQNARGASAEEQCVLQVSFEERLEETRFDKKAIRMHLLQTYFVSGLVWNNPVGKLKWRLWIFDIFTARFSARFFYRDFLYIFISNYCVISENKKGNKFLIKCYFFYII